MDTHAVDRDRFDEYVERLAGRVGHADRRWPLEAYLTGLLLSGKRKSVEPMAAKIDPRHVSRAHQSMHHFVANAPWDERAVLAAARLYLPEEWAKDAGRRTAVGVPEDIIFLEKWRIALEEIDALLAQELPPAPVVADAGYGDTTGFREGLTERGFSYVVGIKGTTTVWAPGKQPLPPRSRGRGRPPTCLRRDGRHRPLSVRDLADMLPKEAWRSPNSSVRHHAPHPIRSLTRRDPSLLPHVRRQRLSHISMTQ